MTDEAWAKSVLQGLQRVETEAQSDRRSSASYWNGDD